jgi:NADH-quinone oxidoreductase subunit K
VNLSFNSFIEVGLLHYLSLAGIVFIIGISGIFLNRKNIITLLMSIEIMLLAVNINFVAFSYYLHDLTGQLFSIFVLTVAASEAAIGLAILVVYYRKCGNIYVEELKSLRG